VAERGFPVDTTFANQVNENLVQFSQFTASSALYLPGGKAPAAGTTFRNPDLAATYRSLARDGVEALYRGPIGRDVVQAVQHPPVAPNPAQPWQYQIRPGTMTAADLAAYRVREPEPTHSRYRGLDVYGMATPSSGGTAVGEALNILETSRLSQLPKTQVEHRYLEASALAFADRNRYVGDYTPRATLDRLLSDRFAATRACQISPTKALPKPVAPGPLDATGCAPAAAGQPSTQGTHTTNLTVSDRWGNVVEYTLTIEQTGGNAMVVPGRGFLLNNELTDFNFTDTQAPAANDPNLPGPNKRPRSSISPTIILSHGRPYLALGTPGGSTIITTVLQTLVNRLDLRMGLLDAVAAPRATQRNTATVQAEQGYLDAPEAAGLTALGHRLTLYTSSGGPDIGAATAIEFRRGGQTLAVAEPVRRGGGSAAVVRSCGLTGADQSLVQVG
jgi:gamma-glutamyltranspeptidase/glutathione hydrolase